MKFWKDNCEKGMPDFSKVPPSKRKMGSLSESDLNIFKDFPSVDIDLLKEFQLSDILLELGLLFNEKLVQSVKKQIFLFFFPLLKKK